MGLVIPRKVKQLKRAEDVRGLLAIVNDRMRGDRERRSAVVCLGELEASAACDDLIVALRDRVVRGLAAQALGQIGCPSACLPLLELGETTRDDSVRIWVGHAIDLLHMRYGDAEFERVLTASVTYAEAGRQRFAERGDLPVESWPDCPMCERVLDTQLEHSCFCRQCGRYYTSSDHHPSVSLEKETFEFLRGSQETRFPSEMVQSMGFPLLGRFPTNLAWRVWADLTSDIGGGLRLDRPLMAAAATEWIARQIES